jgi:hypothetical protein
MHKRAEYSGILISLENLTPGKQRQWLESQPEAKTRKKFKSENE